jgi:hypothetical protein
MKRFVKSAREVRRILRSWNNAKPAAYAVTIAIAPVHSAVRSTALFERKRKSRSPSDWFLMVCNNPQSPFRTPCSIAAGSDDAPDLPSPEVRGRILSPETTRAADIASCDEATAIFHKPVIRLPNACAPAALPKRHRPRTHRPARPSGGRGNREGYTPSTHSEPYNATELFFTLRYHSELQIRRPCDGARRIGADRVPPYRGPPWAGSRAILKGWPGLRANTCRTDPRPG